LGLTDLISLNILALLAKPPLPGNLLWFRGKGSI